MYILNIGHAEGELIDLLCSVSSLTLWPSQEARLSAFACTVRRVLAALMHLRKAGSHSHIHFTSRGFVSVAMASLLVQCLHAAMRIASSKNATFCGMG